MMSDLNSATPMDRPLTIAIYKNKFIGTQVVAETSEGELYTGILKECTEEFVITLSFAQKMPTLEECQFILCEEATKKELKLTNVVRLTGSIDEKEQSHQAFRTDREIVSGINGAMEDKDPELLPWNAETDEKDTKRSCRNVWEDGWKVEAMFEMNKDKVVGKSTFDESLSQYSNVEVKDYTDEDIRRAEQIVKAIEGCQDSKRNALLENDDEERDLDVTTDFKMESRPESLQQPPQLQQRTQRAGKEGSGSRKVIGNSTLSGFRWTPDRGAPVWEKSAEQASTNWRTSNTQPSQHQQRGHYSTKSHQSTSSYHQQQQPRKYQQQYHQTPYFGGGKGNRNAGGRPSNYEVNSTQSLSTERARSDIANESRTTPGSNVKPLNESAATNNHPFQPHIEEQSIQQIPPDPEIVEKKMKSEQGSEETEERGKNSPSVEEKMNETNNKEEERESGEQQKEAFKLNPAAAPFIPKSKDIIVNTSPLMSSQVSSFIQVPSAPTQGIATQNLVFYHQQPQTVVPPHSNPLYKDLIVNTTSATSTINTNPLMSSQVPSFVQVPSAPTQGIATQNLVFYHQQPQTVVPPQIPSNPLYKDLIVNTTSATSTINTNPLMSSQVPSFVQVPSAPTQGIATQNLVFYHQQPQTVVPTQISSNSLYATYPVAVILQHYPPPPLHPGTQGMIIQSSPVQPLLNLTMPPNAVVSAPPPFYPAGRHQHQQF
uniref:LsmAD domain-containing protein n=1 Tax=Globodera rostochiensis TaxID=31243 RepID=A0A914HCX4_GLORO